MPSGPYRLGAEVLAHGRGAECCYWLRAGMRDVPLDEGKVLIGRGEECDIQISERGVSRRHACVRMDGGRVHVEDLGSENGTFVNGARVYGIVPLAAGDFITIGTRVLEVYEYEREPASDVHDRPTLASGIAPLGAGSSLASEGDAPGPETDRLPRRRVVHIEEFEAAGRLADRMLALGRTAAAEQILAEPIMDVLEATREGEPPAVEMLDVVGRYGVRLANSTLDMRWVDAAIELHLLAARPMRFETLRQLATARSRTHLGDDALISRYCEVLRSRFNTMTQEDQALTRLVAQMIPDSNRDK